MLYIRGSRCIIEYHYRLRRQKDINYAIPAKIILAS